MGGTRAGRLLLIGGREDKRGDRAILRRVVEMVGDGKLVVATVASTEANALWRDYEAVFRGLGLAHVWHLTVGSRSDADSSRTQRILEDATAVFFTGGDQLKISTRLGGSAAFDRVHEIFAQGGLIAGTSAGASAMSETMLVAGPANDSARVGSAARTAPGLGLLRHVVIDQHFAQRGRLARLVSAVAQDPRITGIGIDEDTAIEVYGDDVAVLGSGAVYVLQGRELTGTTISEERHGRTFSVSGLTLDVLSQGDQYDLRSQRATLRVV